MISPSPYTIMPFRFSRCQGNQYLVINEAGEYLFLDNQTFHSFVNHDLSVTSDAFLDLKGKHFATNTDIVPVIELLATKYRTKKAFLRNFTVLHMVVITARCNHRCRYCHASSEDVDAAGWDMSPEVARKVCETILQAPSPSVKIEFQGGEPLLNWSAVKEIVNHAKIFNRNKKKNIEFVLCTNLTLVNEEKLHFIKNHGIAISTSLDGPRDIHDSNRILRNGDSSYDLFVERLAFARDYLGRDKVSALMTTPVNSLGHMKDIIDEYVLRGFDGIFLRALNPFGFAKIDCQKLGYPTGAFIEAYKDALQYIIELNLKGIYFEEYYTSLLLTRILTPFSTGFVDLQSPSGSGISGAIYDRNGDVYPCDEARMLAKMGDKKFLLGNVMRDGYLEIFGSNALRKITTNACVETLPGCATCVFQIFCGVDPIRNYVEQGDTVGHRPTSSFCRKNKAIFELLFQIFRENSEDVMDVFWSWITRRPLQDIRNVELPRHTS